MKLVKGRLGFRFIGDLVAVLVGCDERFLDFFVQHLFSNSLERIKNNCVVGS